MVKKKSLAAGRRAVALFFAFSLVLTMASAPPAGPVGQVAASHAECSETDELFWVMSLGYLGNPFGVNEQCDPSALSDHADELEDAHENATEVEIYNSGSQTAADTEQFSAVMGNQLQDSGTPAMSKAEAAAVLEIDAGGDRAAVEAAAVEAVEDHYTRMQMNQIDKWNVVAQTVWTMENTSDAAGLDDTFVRPQPRVAGNSVDSDELTNTIIGIQESGTLTLINDSEYLTMQIQIVSDGTYPDAPNSHNIHLGTGAPLAVDNPSWDRITAIRVEPIPEQTSVDIVDFDDWQDDYNAIIDKSAQIEANAEVYAGSLYNQTQNGTADISDYVSGATLAQEYATDYNSTGFYSHLVGFSATQGMAIPDLSTTSLMEIQTSTESYEGLLMSQESPTSGVWEVDTAYNSASIEGKQFVARVDGEIVELEGEFSIISMEGPDGESVDSTTSQEFNYTVTNETAGYTALQEDIRTLRDEIEDVEPPGGSGGGGGDGGLGLDLGIGGSGIVIVAAAAAAFLLLGRN